MVQLANRLGQVFDNINSTLFFEVQTIDGLTDHLLASQQERLVERLGMLPFVIYRILLGVVILLLLLVATHRAGVLGEVAQTVLAVAGDRIE